MDKSLQTTTQGSKILKTDFKMVVDTSEGVAVARKVPITLEKALILTFNNGEKLEHILIKNLAEKRGDSTKEQSLNRAIMERHGHIMVLDDKGESRIIRVSNIISVDTKWVEV